MPSSRSHQYCVFVTGAGGFVGRHLVAHLLERHRASGGDSVRIVALAHRRDPVVEHFAAAFGLDCPLEVVEADVLDVPTMSHVVAEHCPGTVIHLAARASGADLDQASVFAVNVEGTRNVLNAAAPFRSSVILVSTGYVYGNTSPERPAVETDPIDAAGRFGPYAASKVAMEALASTYPGPLTIVRPFQHAGPGQPPRFAIPSFARQLARIEAGLEPPVLRVGNLEALRDMLDVRDVVRAYGAMMEPCAAGNTYNISTGRPVRMGDILNGLRSSCRTPTEVIADPALMRPLDIACSSGDPARIRETFAWSPRIPLAVTLADTLEYWRAQTANEIAKPLRT